jgi:predicted DNA-binding transcriptional regulator AlpA
MSRELDSFKERSVMPAIRPTDDDWMSLAEFAKIVGKKISSIHNERSRGKDFPPSYSFSKKQVRLRRSDVDAWLEKHRKIPAETRIADLTA